MHGETMSEGRITSEKYEYWN